MKNIIIKNNNEQLVKCNNCKKEYEFMESKKLKNPKKFVCKNCKKEKEIDKKNNRDKLIKCKLCGELFEIIPVWHIKKCSNGKMTYQEYKEKYGKENIYSQYYCDKIKKSNKETWSHSDIKKKHSEAVKKGYKEFNKDKDKIEKKHNKYREAMKKKYEGPRYREYRKNLAIEYGKNLSDKTRLKMSESKKEAWKDLDNRKKYLEALSKGRKKPSWRASDIKNLNKSKNIKVSKLSYKFAEILDKLKIKYEMEKEEVWYLVDFSLPDYNLIIEVDGTYWHGDERFYDKFSDQQIKIKKRDIKKNNFLVNHKGYYLIRFLEHDIHNNLDLCISQLDFKIDEIILRRKKIKNAFLTGKLFIESSNKNGIIQKKKIKDVYRHICPHKEIYRITTKNKDKVVITGDHALFNFKNNKINEISAKDATKKIICQQENKLVEIEIKNHKKIESRLYMYDLSVEDNENFCLENGILVHNSMSPPSSEKEIQGFTKIRGHRWPNDILLSHLYNALDWINSTKSPFTNFGLSQVAFRNSQRYVAGIRPLVLMQASIFAMIDLATLWIHEEFDYSMNGISLAINRYDKYSGMASQLQGMIDQQLESYKAGIKYTKGLGQSRYTYGRGASIGPWVSGNGNLKSWIGSFRTGFAPGFR